MQATTTIPLQAVSTPPKGVVHPAAAQKVFRLERYLPEPDLAPFIDYFWLVEWRLPEGVTHVQRTLPSPCVHLVFDAGRTAVFGVMVDDAFDYTLTGHGHVLGVRFRTGGFRGFLGAPLASITDRVLPLAPLFGCDDAEAERAVLGAPDDAGMVAAASAVIRAALPAVDPAVERIEGILRVIEQEPGITQVRQLAEHTGISVRRLQLLFKEYVGASPKWVIRRKRLLHAAEQLGNGSAVDLAGLAQALGYFDQAHFTSDFEKLVGKPPAEYRRREAEDK